MDEEIILCILYEAPDIIIIYALTITSVGDIIIIANAKLLCLCLKVVLEWEGR